MKAHWPKAQKEHPLAQASRTIVFQSIWCDTWEISVTTAGDMRRRDLTDAEVRQMLCQQQLARRLGDHPWLKMHPQIPTHAPRESPAPGTPVAAPAALHDGGVPPTEWEQEGEMLQNQGLDEWMSRQNINPKRSLVGSTPGWAQRQWVGITRKLLGLKAPTRRGGGHGNHKSYRTKGPLSSNAFDSVVTSTPEDPQTPCCTCGAQMCNAWFCDACLQEVPDRRFLPDGPSGATVCMPLAASKTPAGIEVEQSPFQKAADDTLNSLLQELILIMERAARADFDHGTSHCAWCKEPLSPFRRKLCHNTLPGGVKCHAWVHYGCAVFKDWFQAKDYSLRNAKAFCIPCAESWECPFCKKPGHRWDCQCKRCCTCPQAG